MDGGSWWLLWRVSEVYVLLVVRRGMNEGGEGLGSWSGWIGSRWFVVLWSVGLWVVGLRVL